jgi:hypothetical protein
MKQTEIVKRAFWLTVRNPVFWIFGILMALTSGSGSWSQSRYNFDQTNRGDVLSQAPWLGRVNPGTWAGIAVCLCCLLLIVIVVSLIVQYVARTALYRMVDQTEETGVKPTWRQGFRLGWSNRTFRLFMLELIVVLAAGIAGIILLTLAASPLLFLLIKSPAARWAGVGLTVALELFAILILVVASIVLYVLQQFWAREITLAGRGIGEAFAGGYHLVRGRIKDAGLMWLLLLAIGIGWGIVLLVIGLVVILTAVGLGAGVGFGVYGITHSIPWGVLAGLPVFVMIASLPLLFLQGLYAVFSSSAWTLAYREIAAGPAAAGDDLPAVLA